MRRGIGNDCAVRPDAFERLYQAHAQRLLWFLEYRTGDRTLAEDLVADTFEKVLRSRTRFDPRRGTEKTWVYSIALNTLRDHSRRGAAERRALERAASAGAEPSGRAGTSDELLQVERRDQLIDALAALSEEEREAIALRYGADLTVREMAKVTGERRSTVDGRVYRALRKLRDRLQEPP
jgi:RNA polymerase sigma factor (sigma-70 family)